LGNAHAEEIRVVRRRKVKSKKRLFLRVAGICTLMTIVALTSVGFRFYNDYRRMQYIVEVDTIYNGIYVNGIGLGGLTRSQAQQMLESSILGPARSNTVTLVHGDEAFTYTFQDFGVDVNVNPAVEMAYDFAREGTTRERYDQIQSLIDNPINISVDLTFVSIDEVQQIIAPLQEVLYTNPTDATMTRSGGAFTVIEGTYGSTMNLIATSQEIYNLLNLNQSGDVSVIFDPVAPEFSGDVFREAQNLLGTFTSNFPPGNNGRNANIANAARKINGYIVFPGEVFSTNDAFGAMTYANGYRYAPIILNGQFVDGIGGGICQVSTNLYMALLYAELQIVQRQNHSRMVSYVPPAFDATLATGLIDLKFLNNTEHPVFIETIVTNNAVTVNVYGKETRPANRSLSFESVFVENIAPPEETIIQDSSLPAGTRVVQTPARNGVRYRLYKIISVDGSVVGRQRMNTSTYRAAPAVVRVGTGEVPPPPAPEPEATPEPQPMETGNAAPPVIED